MKEDKSQIITVQRLEPEIITEWKIEHEESLEEMKTFDAAETLSNMRLAFGSE